MLAATHWACQHCKPDASQPMKGWLWHTPGVSSNATCASTQTMLPQIIEVDLHGATDESRTRPVDRACMVTFSGNWYGWKI